MFADVSWLCYWKQVTSCLSLARDLSISQSPFKWCWAKSTHPYFITDWTAEITTEFSFWDQPLLPISFFYFLFFQNKWESKAIIENMVSYYSNPYPSSLYCVTMNMASEQKPDVCIWQESKLKEFGWSQCILCISQCIGLFTNETVY